MEIVYILYIPRKENSLSTVIQNVLTFKNNFTIEFSLPFYQVINSENIRILHFKHLIAIRKSV